MGIETILIGIVAAIAGIFGAFFAGRSKGKSTATADAAIRQAATDSIRIVESNKKSAEAEIKAATNSTEVRNEVSMLNDGDAANELRNSFARDSDGNKSN